MSKRNRKKPEPEKSEEEKVIDIEIQEESPDKKELPKSKVDLPRNRQQARKRNRELAKKLAYDGTIKLLLGGRNYRYDFSPDIPHVEDIDLESKGAVAALAVALEELSWLLSDSIKLNGIMFNMFAGTDFSEDSVVDYINEEDLADYLEEEE